MFLYIISLSKATYSVPFWGLPRARWYTRKEKNARLQVSRKGQKAPCFSEGTGISCSFCQCFWGRRLMPFSHQPTKGQWYFSSDNNVVLTCPPGWPSCPWQLQPLPPADHLHAAGRCFSGFHSPCTGHWVRTSNFHQRLNNSIFSKVLPEFSSVIWEAVQLFT